MATINYSWASVGPNIAGERMKIRGIYGRQRRPAGAKLRWRSGESGALL